MVEVRAGVVDDDGVELEAFGLGYWYDEDAFGEVSGVGSQQRRMNLAGQVVVERAGIGGRAADDGDLSIASATGVDDVFAIDHLGGGVGDGRREVGFVDTADLGFAAGAADVVDGDAAAEDAGGELGDLHAGAVAAGEVEALGASG